MHIAIPILLYEIIHLARELTLPQPAGGQRCRVVVAMPTVDPARVARHRNYVDYVIVDNEEDARVVEALGVKCLVNKYMGKSGALATLLESVEADSYVFIDDDVVPGVWVEILKNASCGKFVTAYRWVLDKLQNAFSLGGFDWMVWRRTRFLYGGAMAVPSYKKREAVEALLSCPIDDMALTAIADEIEVLPILVPMEKADGGFYVRQAVAAKFGNPLLWSLELAYYTLWTAAALFFPALFVIHAVRTALRSRRALGRVDWGQVVLSPLERPIQAAVFIASIPRKCFKWRGRRLCLKRNFELSTCYGRGRALRGGQSGG